MPRCLGIKKDGGQCRNNAHADNGLRCKTHYVIFLRNEPLIQEAGEIREQAIAGGMRLCTGIRQNGSACIHRATHGDLCGVHRRSEMIAARREQRRARRFQMIDMYWNRHIRGAELLDVLDQWNAEPNAMELGMNEITRLVNGWMIGEKQRLLWHRLTAFHDTREQLVGQIDQWLEHREINTPVALMLERVVDLWMAARQADEIRNNAHRARQLDAGPLARFANDTQNVHTQEAAAQMRDGVQILVAASNLIVHGTQNTLREVTDAFIALKPNPVSLRNVFNDMHHWHHMRTVTSEGDWLFRRALRGLWYTIKKFEGETYNELVNRLWQESCDSVGMCAQGHMARLTNVLIGFDEAFKPTISVGEQLQQKMAAIAGMENTEEEKVALARSVLAELKVPEDQHSAWLEAL